MVTLDKLRIDMEKQLAFDKDIHTVEVRADTLDECLDDAAVQLDSKKNNLEYENFEIFLRRRSAAEHADARNGTGR